MAQPQTCSACKKPLDEKEGVGIWTSKFCSTCFITNAAKLDHPLTPDQVAMLRIMGRELSGLLPPELLEMLLVAFWRRSTGRNDSPPGEQLALTVGEIQRLVAFANLRKTLGLLKTWQDSFNEFVEGQEEEIRSTIKRLTDFDQA